LATEYTAGTRIGIIPADMAMAVEGSRVIAERAGRRFQALELMAHFDPICDENDKR